MSIARKQRYMTRHITWMVMHCLFFTKAQSIDLSAEISYKSQNSVPQILDISSQFKYYSSHSKLPTGRADLDHQRTILLIHWKSWSRSFREQYFWFKLNSLIDEHRYSLTAYALDYYYPEWIAPAFAQTSVLPLSCVRCGAQAFCLSILSFRSRISQLLLPAQFAREILCSAQADLWSLTWPSAQQLVVLPHTGAQRFVLRMRWVIRPVDSHSRKV